MNELIIVFWTSIQLSYFNGGDMAKSKKHTSSGFTINRMYASRTIKLSALGGISGLILSGCIVPAKCKFKAIDITDEDALKIAKIEFEEDGYYEENNGG